MRLTAALLTSTVGILLSSGGGVSDAFAIGGASPELVAAFTTASDGTTAGEYFRKASSETTFGDLFTHSVSGLTTMFDSTGTLCYAPHNFMDGSHNFDNASYWYTADISIAAASTNGPDGSTKMWALTDNNASLLAGMLDVGNVTVNGQNIFEIWITKDEDETRFPRVVFSPFNTQINTKTGAVHHFGSQDNFEITEAIPGLWRCRWTFTRNGATDVFIYPAAGSTLSTSDASATGTAEFGFISIRRADLPMADNPDQPTGLEKYVPTTTAAVYGPRRNAYYYNAAWVKGGLLAESAAATQLLHGTDSFATQDETVTAQAYTLQFRGTGSITLSGAHSATLNGTGANDLVSLTFTPSAGTLTLTPSGTVNYPQLETGSAPTSYIPNTAGSGTATRAAETLSIAGADTPFNTTGFTIYEKGLITYADNASGLEAQLARINQDANNNHEWRLNTVSTATGVIQTRVEAGGTIDTSQTTNELTPGVNVAFAVASRYTSSELQVALNGTASTANTSIPSITDMSATAFEPVYSFNGYISELRYWGTDLAESGIEEVTS